MRYPVSKPSIGDAEYDEVNDALDHVQLSQGEKVRILEAMLCEYLHVKHVVLTTSGTTALHLVLAALNIGPGDEVLVPDLTFVATANAVNYTGATTVLVDVEEHSWCMDMEDARRKVTERTKAVIPVHLYGVSCDFRKLPYGVPVIEDAAEGFSGSWRGCKLGTIGKAGIFSFYGNKIMTCGEGGAVCTEDDELAARLRFLRGQALDPTRRYYHPELGFNYRMTDLQASVGIGQMRRLSPMIERRHEIFSVYQSRLCYTYGVAPYGPFDSWTAPWLFTLKLDRTSREQHPAQRDLVIARLAERGIETRPAFVPLHRLPMYRKWDVDFPKACEIGDRAISLPTYPELTPQDVHTICDEFIEVLKNA